MSEFAVNLKKLASICDFGTFLPDAIRDCFVCGLRSISVQKKLLADDHTFQQALKLALNYEGAEKDVSELNPKPTDSVNKIRPSITTRKPPAPSARDHHRIDWRYRNLTCHTCGKHSHISRVCKSANVVNQVDHTPPMENPSDPFAASLYKVGSNKQTFLIPVDVQGQSDGARYWGKHINYFPQKNQRYFSTIPLMPSSATLHTYSGGAIPVCGQFTAVVNYQKQQVHLPLTVVSGSGPSLFGCVPINTLFWSSAFTSSHPAPSCSFSVWAWHTEGNHSQA